MIDLTTAGRQERERHSAHPPTPISTLRRRLRRRRLTSKVVVSTGSAAFLITAVAVVASHRDPKTNNVTAAEPVACADARYAPPPPVKATAPTLVGGVSVAPLSTDPVYVTMNALDATLSKCDPESYAGLEQQKGRVLIHVLNAGRRKVQADIIATLDGRPHTLPPSSVEYTSATATIASLSARATRLSLNRQLLRSEGVQVVDSGPDIRANTLSVAVSSPLASARPKIEALVGSNNLVVRAGHAAGAL